MSPDAHGVFMEFPDGSRAFVDGIPDICQHDSYGSGYHFISFTREHGGGFCDMIPDTGQTQEEMITMDEELRKNGKYLSGGCVSCSKCGKPFTPPLF